MLIPMVDILAVFPVQIVLAQNCSRGDRFPNTLANSQPLRTVSSQRALGAFRFSRVAPLIADPPRWPIQFTGKLAVQVSSRQYRFILGVALGDDAKTPKHAHQVAGRLDVDLPLVSAEATPVVVEYPSRYRREPGADPVDLL